MNVDVCLVSPYFYPIMAGGAERFRRYAPGLRKRGINLKVIAAQVSDAPPLESVDGVQVHRLPVNANSRHSRSALLRSALNVFRRTDDWPDVLQIFSQTTRNVPLLSFARFHGVACLYVSTMVKSVSQSNRGQLGRLRNRAALRLSLAPVNCVIASSTVMAERLLAAGASPSCMEIVPNGVDPNRFKPLDNVIKRNQLRHNLGFDENDKIVLFIGAITPRKGADLLIAAWPEIFAQAPQTRLVLVGPQPDHTSQVRQYRRKIDELVRKSPAPERIHFVGTVDNPEAYMQAADVLAFPSKKEGMGNVVAEAMASGLPCILTPFEGLPTEFGEAGREYVLVGHDSHELAINIIRLLRGKEMRDRIGAAARNWVETNLNVEESLDRYAEIYHRLAAAL